MKPRIKLKAKKPRSKITSLNTEVPDKSVIGLLEDLLEDAKTGDLRSVSIVALHSRSRTSWICEGVYTIRDMHLTLGVLSEMRFDFEVCLARNNEHSSLSKWVEER